MSAAASCYLGIDLAWSTGWTGVAVTDRSGALRASGRIRSDADLDSWIAEHAPNPTVVAVDAPLVVPNETGQRQAERLIGRAFGTFGSSAHASNRAAYGDETRAMRLARRHGWDVDPAGYGEHGRPRCIEVYPHPALIGLFRLDYRLAYKKGRLADRQPGFRRLMGMLATVDELRLPDHSRWSELEDVVEAGRGLDRIEDELDAILCAHLAWLWQERRGSLQVYGTLQEGYIVAPHPPTWPSVRPQRDVA